MYLAAKEVVHTRLMASNILLMHDRTAKISGFGLYRYINEKEFDTTLECQLPLKWSAPEALAKGQFSEKSDV